MTKKTRIDEIQEQEANRAKARPVRVRGSMADAEKKHGTAPAPSAAEVARKAAKAKIDPKAYGVEDTTPEKKQK